MIATIYFCFYAYGLSNGARISVHRVSHVVCPTISLGSPTDTGAIAFTPFTVVWYLDFEWVSVVLLLFLCYHLVCHTTIRKSSVIRRNMKSPKPSYCGSTTTNRTLIRTTLRTSVQSLMSRLTNVRMTSNQSVLRRRTDRYRLSKSNIFGALCRSVQ
jgi:hypothetical protein